MSEKEQDGGAGLSSGSTPPERREPRRSAPPKRLSLPPPRPPTDPGQETPLAQVTFPPLSGIENEHTGDIRPLEILGTLTTDLISSLPTSSLSPDDPGIEHPPVALGETLQLVHYTRRGETLLISGITPHGRRLTFEQREDRQGWYVLAAGRRRRPTERELGLVVATITQEMEAALVPERQAEVRSAYRLAVASDQPGLMVPGLDAYRDLLLDESQAYVSGLIDRLAVVAVDYQAFKRFANRHGHRIGAAFVRALGERLYQLFAEETDVHVFHKSGKSFRLVLANRTSAEANALVDQIVSDDTRSWLVRRVWGHDPRTHVTEVHFHVGIASASPAERDSTPRDLAQRLSDDAYRASKLGQLKGHTSIALAQSDYRTTIYRWSGASDAELYQLAAEMDDGPAEVMAQMSDYLHELVPADLDGMAVAGDLDALLHCAVARDGFWQGTTAMRIAGERLIRRALDPSIPRHPEELDFVGGFDLGDEFYGIALEGDTLYFARGDINSAGATRLRAGLAAVQRAVGWRRADDGGLVGRFIGALEDRASGVPLLERIRSAAQKGYQENEADPELRVNDAVDIADFLFTTAGDPITGLAIADDVELVLAVPGSRKRKVRVLERRSTFTLRLDIDGVECPAVLGLSEQDPAVRLRLRNTVATVAICLLEIPIDELKTLLAEIREENDRSSEDTLDVLGFLRHIADIVLEDHVKQPAKIELALGTPYDARRFVRSFRLEDIREGYPGLFYEAVHSDLLAEEEEADLDRQLVEVLGRTMLSSARPQR